MDSPRDEQHRPGGMRVVDRRKFNADGSLRDHADESEASPDPEPAAPSGAAASAEPPAEPPAEDRNDEPGREQGTPLLSLMYSLAASAQMALGDVAHPATGARYVNLEEAQGYIDILTDLERKTEGRLTPMESRFLRSALYELRMRFTARQQELLTRRQPS